jgi:UDP-2,3-diacylglucosamine hydrolase
MNKDITLASGQKIYFASDNHLGAPDPQKSRPRELHFVTWLEGIRKDAAAIFLLGDLFDFWFEYKRVVPKGFTRTLGKLAEIADSGVPIYYFVGNHDLWMHGYFEAELGISVFHKPQYFNIEGKTFLIGHGDGLGPGDKGYKRMKKVFTNPFSKWLYRWLHPDIGVKLAQYLSIKNKLISGAEDVVFLGEDQEWLVQYAKKKIESKDIDFFVFGHRHLPLHIALSQKATYLNTGDWISYYSFGEFDGQKLHLKYFPLERK